MEEKMHASEKKAYARNSELVKAYAEIKNLTAITTSSHFENKEELTAQYEAEKARNDLLEAKLKDMEKQ